MDALTAIFASKLFQSSKNKDRIYATATDPINKELVQQLDSYLDIPEEEKVVKNKIEHSEKEKEHEESVKPEKESVRIDHTSHVTHHGPSTSKVEPESNGEASTSEKEEAPKEEAEKQTEKESTKEEPKEEEVETSIKASKQFKSSIDYISECLDSIKGLLNADASTAGVNRLLIKEAELWCYYVDSINMNDIMANVIQVLAASGYDCLEFNRLARSDNAIVFEIDQSSTVYPKDVEEVIEEESK